MNYKWKFASICVRLNVEWTKCILRPPKNVVPREHAPCALEVVTILGLQDTGWFFIPKIPGFVYVKYRDFRIDKSPTVCWKSINLLIYLHKEKKRRDLNVRRIFHWSLLSSKNCLKLFIRGLVHYFSNGIYNFKYFDNSLSE